MEFPLLSGRGNFFRRAISLVLVQTFLVSTIAFAAPQDLAPTTKPAEVITDPEKIVIPKEAGIVKSKFIGNSGKLVVHIQDAHCNFEAQSNIAKIIEALVKNDNLSLVSVEGADGFIDTSWFKAFPDDEVRKEVATYFMKKGEITGPEFLSITTSYPIKLFGAETRSYYIENLNAFMASYPYKAETEKYYTQIKNALNKLKTYIYNDELKVMDTRMDEYESKKISFNDYIRFLQWMAEKHKINLRQYENFFKLVSVLTYEKKIDFSVVDKERAALIDELSKKMPKEELTDLVTKSLSFKVGKISSAEFYDYLRKLSLKHGIELAKVHPNLFNYIIYNAVYSKIENDKLFHDIKLLEMAIKEKLFENDDQRELERLSRHVDTLLGLINIKLLNGDFEYYKTHKEEFSHDTFIDFLTKKSAQFGLAVTIEPPNDAIANSTVKLEDFYHIAIKRDRALVDNTVAAMKKEKTQIAVLVTGGFHSEGIAKLLEKEGISYLVVCPCITKDAPTPYIQILTNQRTPFEQLLVGTAEAKEEGKLAPILISETVPMYFKKNKALQALSAEVGKTDGQGISERTQALIEGWVNDYATRWYARVQARMGGDAFIKDPAIMIDAFRLALESRCRNLQLSAQESAAMRKTIMDLAEPVLTRVVTAAAETREGERSGAIQRAPAPIATDDRTQVDPVMRTALSERIARVCRADARLNNVEVEIGGLSSIDLTLANKTRAINDLFARGISRVQYYGDDPQGNDRVVFEMAQTTPSLHAELVANPADTLNKIKSLPPADAYVFDYDGTVAQNNKLMMPEMAKALAGILKSGKMVALLTSKNLFELFGLSATPDTVTKDFVNAIADALRDLGVADDQIGASLKNLVLYMDKGATRYTVQYDAAQHMAVSADEQYSRFFGEDQVRAILKALSGRRSQLNPVRDAEMGYWKIDGSGLDLVEFFKGLRITDARLLDQLRNNKLRNIIIHSSHVDRMQDATKVQLQFMRPGTVQPAESRPITKKAPNATDLSASEMGRIESVIAAKEAAGEFEDIKPVKAITDAITRAPGYGGLLSDIENGKVVVRAIDLGTNAGFSRDNPLDREIYSYAKVKDGVLYIYTTKIYAFLANPYFNVELAGTEEGDSQIEQGHARFAQNLIHEYAETILGKSHAEATRDEMAAASAFARTAGVPDSNLFILDKAAEEGDAAYLLNILRNYDAGKDPHGAFKKAVINALGKLMSLHLIEKDVDAVAADATALAGMVGVDAAMITADVAAGVQEAVTVARDLIRKSITRALVKRAIDKEQDLRGNANGCFTAEVAYRIAKAYGSELISANPHGKDLSAERLVVALGKDARLSNPRLKKAIMRGLNELGVDVVDTVPGNLVTTTPMVPYAVASCPNLNTALGGRKIDGGMQLTASHLEYPYGGIKMYISDNNIEAAALQSVLQRAEDNSFAAIAKAEGTVIAYTNLREDYAHHIESVMRAQLGTEGLRMMREKTFVVDPGNGTGEVFAEVLRRLGAKKVIGLYAEPNGFFPNHLADPNKWWLLGDLVETVQSSGADLGVAFDSDSDRVGFVSSKGKHISGHELLMYLADNALKTRPGKSIVFNNRATQGMEEVIVNRGGVPVRAPTGYTKIINKIHEIGEEEVAFGGEESKHIMFAENGFRDDGVFSAAMFISMLATETEPIDDVLARYPHYNTEIVSKQRLTGADAEICRQTKREIERDVATKLEQLRGEWKITRPILTEDGTWVYMDDLQGWALIRGSLSETKILGIDIETKNPYDALEMYCRVYQLLKPFADAGKIKLDDLVSRITEKAGGFSELIGFMEDELNEDQLDEAYKICEATDMTRAAQQEALIALVSASLEGDVRAEALKKCAESYDTYLAQQISATAFLDRNIEGRPLEEALQITENFCKERLAQQDIIDPRFVIAYAQGLRIAGALVNSPDASARAIHQLTKKVFASMQELHEQGLRIEEEDKTVNPLIVAIRMKALRQGLESAIASGDATAKRNALTYYTSLINQYIAFIKLTMGSMEIKPAERALIDREIEVARNYVGPIQAGAERAKLISAIRKLYGIDTISSLPTDEEKDAAIRGILLNNQPGTLRNLIEHAVGTDIVASQRIGTEPEDLEKQRDLAFRFMKAVCIKMAEADAPLLSTYTTNEAEFKQFERLFNEHFGVLFAVMAGGSGSRYSLVTHKSQGATFTGMSNVDLALRGAFHTPVRPTNGQDSHYLIASLFTIMTCLSDDARLGLMRRDEAAIEHEDGLWPETVGMRKVEADEMSKARAERALPARTYFLRQNPGTLGYGGSFMVDIKFMIDQQKAGKLPDVPYFMRLDGEQATLHEKDVANIALITWMTAVAEDNLVTLGLREDKVIEGKGMPIDEPLLGVIRFLQDWRNIPPSVVQAKLLGLLKDIPENAALRRQVEDWLKLSDEQKGLLIEQIHGDTAIEQRNPMLINANIVVMRRDAADYFDSVQTHDQLAGQVNDRTNTPEFAPADVTVCIFDDYAKNKPGERIPLGFAVVSKGPSAIKNTFKQSEFNTFWQREIRGMLERAGADISGLEVLTINPGPAQPVFNLEIAQEMLFGRDGVFTGAVNGKIKGVKLSGKVHIDLRAKIGNQVTIENSYILGKTVIGEGSRIKGTTLLDVTVGNRCTLDDVYLKDGRTVADGSVLNPSNTATAVGSYSRANERPVLTKIYERSSSESEPPSEQVCEVLAGATFSPIESVLLAQDIDGEAILKIIKEMREQEFGEEEHTIDIDHWKRLPKNEQVQYVARQVVKNMGLFTSLASMDPPLEGQPLTFPISAESLTSLNFKLPGIDRATMELVFKIVSMFGKTEIDPKNRKLRRIDAIHIMGPLEVENEFTRFGTGVTIDGLRTRGRMYAGDGWGIVNSRVDNAESVIVLGDHIMILDPDEDITSYEPPLDGDINSLSVLKDCIVTAKRAYIGPGAGDWQDGYRGKVLQGATIVGDVVIIPEGRNPLRGVDGRTITGIDRIEHNLARMLTSHNKSLAYMLLKSILHGDRHALAGNNLTREGRFTSVATALCLMVQQHDEERVNELLDELMSEAPGLYNALINKLYVIAQIVDPEYVFKQWFEETGRSPIEKPAKSKPTSYSDLRKEAAAHKAQLEELLGVIAACKEEGIEPAMMTTERRMVSVQGKERMQRGFTSEITPLSYYKDPIALGMAILKHSVIKDATDIALVLKGYLAYVQMRKSGQAQSDELDRVKAAMHERWGMDVTDDTVVSIYVAAFGPENYIGIPTDRQFEFTCFRGGRGAHWFLNEIKAQLAEMGVSDLKMTMLPGATDDGRSWLLSSLIFEAPGMPDIGKCLMDIARDRALVEIIGSDGSRFNSIDQLELFIETYKAAREGRITNNTLPSGKQAYKFAQQLYDYGHGKDATVDKAKAADDMATYVGLFYDELQRQRREMNPEEAQNIIIHTLTELREGLLSQKVAYPEENWTDFVDAIWRYLTEPDVTAGAEARRYVASVVPVQREIEAMIGKRDRNGKVLEEGCLIQNLRKPAEERVEALEERLLAILKTMKQKNAQSLREFLYAEFCANMTIPKFGTPIRSAVLVGAHIKFDRDLENRTLAVTPEEKAFMRTSGATKSDIAWQRAIDAISEFLKTQGSVNPATLRRYHLSGVAAGKIDKATGKPMLQLLLSEDAYNEIPKEGEFIFTRLMRRPILDPEVKKTLRQAAKEGNLEEVIRIFDMAHNEASAARGEQPAIVLNPKAAESIAQTNLLFLFPTTLMSNIGPAIMDKRIGEMVAARASALKIYIHNALQENDPPDTTAATMFENLFRILSDQQRYKAAEADWRDVGKYFSYIILRNPCLYTAYAHTYITPDKAGIEARAGDKVATVELDLEDPKSNSKGRYLGPPLMRAVLQLEQLRSLGVRVEGGKVEAFPGYVPADVAALQSQVRGEWDARQRNVSCGNMTREEHDAVENGLRIQLEQFYAKLGAKPGAPLTEEEADRALVDHARELNIDADVTLDMLSSLRLSMRRAGVNKPIFFAVPEGGELLFRVGDKVAAAHYAENAKRVQVSLPFLLHVAKYVDGDMAFFAYQLGRHEAEHINNSRFSASPNHDDAAVALVMAVAEGRGLQKSALVNALAFARQRFESRVKDRGGRLKELAPDLEYRDGFPGPIVKREARKATHEKSLFENAIRAIDAIIGKIQGRVDLSQPHLTEIDYRLVTLGNVAPEVRRDIMGALRNGLIDEEDHWFYSRLVRLLGVPDIRQPAGEGERKYYQRVAFTKNGGRLQKLINDITPFYAFDKDTTLGRANAPLSESGAERLARLVVMGRKVTIMTAETMQGLASKDTPIELYAPVRNAVIQEMEKEGWGSESVNAADDLLADLFELFLGVAATRLAPTRGATAQKDLAIDSNFHPAYTGINAADLNKERAIAYELGLGYRTGYLFGDQAMEGAGYTATKHLQEAPIEGLDLGIVYVGGEEARTVGYLDQEIAKIEAVRHPAAGEPANIACGNMTRAEHDAVENGLRTQLENFYRTLGVTPGEVPLTEEDADQRIVSRSNEINTALATTLGITPTPITPALLKGLRAEMRKAGVTKPIFFAVPENGELLFRVGARVAAAHYAENAKRVQVSLPYLLYNGQLSPEATAHSLGQHEAAHINNPQFATSAAHNDAALNLVMEIASWEVALKTPGNIAERIVREHTTSAAQDAARSLFAGNNYPSANVVCVIGNALFDALKADKTLAPSVAAFFREIITNARALNQPQARDTARELQLTAGRGLDIASWMARSVTAGAENIRLTAAPQSMVQSPDNGTRDMVTPSFLDIATMPPVETQQAGPEALNKQAPGEGKVADYNRGAEPLGKMGANVFEAAVYNPDQLTAQRENAWLYTMIHFVTRVSSAVIDMITNGRITSLHETSFLANFVPGSFQVASTGPGHFQGLWLDVKEVTEGEIIQHNKFYNEKGELIAVVSQRVKAGERAVALPGAVESIENLGNARFNDFSIKLSEAEAEAIVHSINPALNFAKLQAGKAAIEAAAKTVPYYAVVVNGKPALVKNTAVTAPEITWISNVALGANLFNVYSNLTPAAVSSIVTTVTQAMAGNRWTVRQAPIDFITPEELSKAAAAKIAEAGTPILFMPNEKTSILKRYAWGGTGLSRLFNWAREKIAEIWFNSTQRDGVSRVQGTNATLAEVIAANPEAELGPGMTSKPMFAKILGKDEHQPQIAHMGFNKSIVGHEQEFVDLAVQERALMTRLRDELTSGNKGQPWIMTQEQFEEYKAAYEAWVEAQVRVQWSNSAIVPQLPAFMAGFDTAIFEEVRQSRQKMVGYMNEIPLQAGQTILAPVGQIHSIVGSHQTHPPATHQEAKNEAWYIFATQGPNGEEMLLYFEPQQTSNTTYSPFDFPTPIVWDAAKGGVVMRKDLRKGLDALLQESEQAPTTEREAIELMFKRAITLTQSTPEDFLLNNRTRDVTTTPLYANATNARAEALIEGTYPVWPRELFNLHRIQLNGQGAQNPASITVKPSEQRFHEIMVTKGEVEVTIDGKTQTLAAGASMFVPAFYKQPYEIKSKGEAEVMRLMPPRVQPQTLESEGKIPEEETPLTAPELKTQATAPDFKALQTTLATVRTRLATDTTVAPKLEEAVVLLVQDTAIAGRGLGEHEVAQECAKLIDESLPKGSIVHVRDTGAALLQKVATERRQLEANGKKVVVVSAVGDETLQLAGANVGVLGRVINVKNRNRLTNRAIYPSIPGLADVALRTALVEILYKTPEGTYMSDGVQWLLEGFDRIALNPENNTPIVTDDIVQWLMGVKKILEILPKMVPVDTGAILEANRAAAALGRSL